MSSSRFRVEEGLVLAGWSGRATLASFVLTNSLVLLLLAPPLVVAAGYPLLSGPDGFGKAPQAKPFEPKISS
jgi:hypothetical protein